MLGMMLRKMHTCGEVLPIQQLPSLLRVIRLVWVIMFSQVTVHRLVELGHMTAKQFGRILKSESKKIYYFFASYTTKASTRA